MYQIGEVIKRTRESVGITQEVLSDGICSVETLSRIENGKTVPNRSNFRALMERMGKNGERYLPFLHSDNIDLLIQCEEIERKLEKRKYNEVDVLLKFFEMEIDTDDKVNRQRIARLRAINDYHMGKIDEKGMREGLVKALKYTVPNFKENEILSGVFSRCEIRLLCNIAVSYAEGGDLKTAIVLLRNVESYLERINIDIEERYVSWTLLLSNLAQALGQNGETLEALKMNEKGIEICLEAGQGERLHNFLYNAGFEMELLEKEEELCKEKLIQAYYVAELCENKKRMKHIKTHWKKVYGSDMNI